MEGKGAAALERPGCMGESGIGGACKGSRGVELSGRKCGGKQWQGMDKFMKTKIEIITEELNKIEKRDGLITPHALVKEAEPQDSVLHPFFTWDQEKAAYEYRLWEARKIIRTVMIVKDGLDEPVRAFQSVILNASPLQDEEEDQSRAYVSTERCLDDPILRKQILNRAKQEARDWAHKYEALKELSEIVQLIHKKAA